MGNPYQSKGVGSFGSQPQASNTYGSYGTGGPHSVGSLGSTGYGNRYAASKPQEPVAQGYIPPQAEAPPQQAATPQVQPQDSGNNGMSQDQQAADVRTQAGLDQGNVVGKTDPAEGLVNALGIFSGIPGASFVTDKITENFGQDIPAHERAGAAGTIDASSGGIFDGEGRAYDSTTGQALNSYKDKDAFKNGAYSQGIQDDPFSLGSYLSDPDNAHNYSGQKGNAAQGFDFALNNEQGRGMYNQTNGTGNVPTDADKSKLASHIGQTDYGFQEHTVQDGSATNEAIQGNNYSDTGAAGAGSQFSSTGTFSTGGNDDNNDSPEEESYTTTDGVSLSDSDFGNGAGGGEGDSGGK